MNVSNFMPGSIKLRRLKRYLNNMRFKRKLMGKKDSLIIYFLFWALYAPFVLIMWRRENGTLLELSIVMLAGLGLVLLALFVKEGFLDKRRAAHHTPKFERVKRPDQTIVSLDNVFKPNFGKVEIDLD